MTTARAVLPCLALLAAAVALPAMPVHAQAGTTEFVSVTPSGIPGNADSAVPSLSGDGRLVAFESEASDLVPGIFNVGHVFVRDMEAASTIIASVSTAGKKGNSHSGRTAITPDGRFVVFESFATNLAPGDLNLETDIYVRDLVARTTELVSVGLDGLAGNKSSYEASISADGRYVVFTSGATTLTAGDTNLVPDVFVRDRGLGTTSLVSVTPDGTGSLHSSHLGTISGNGRFVAFEHNDTDVVGIPQIVPEQAFVRDLQTGVTILACPTFVPVEFLPSIDNLSLSGDGRFLAFSTYSSDMVPGDTNQRSDVFVRDLVLGVTQRVSLTPDGHETFTGDSGLDLVSLSGDGGRVAFASKATDLWPGGPTELQQTFVRDMATGTTLLASVSTAGVPCSSSTHRPAVSPDGRFACFQSESLDLAPATDLHIDNVFRHELPPGTWQRLGGALGGAAGEPLLDGAGTLAAGTACSVILNAAAPSAPAALFASLAKSSLPFKGGVLQAAPPIVILPLLSDAVGSASLAFTMPPGAPPGTTIRFQCIVADATAPAGFALTGLLEGTTP